ncbi:transposase [Lentibacillus juripiscarius]
MGRKKRIWVPDSFYHVVCRGNRRDALFNDEGDFKTFLYILQQINKKAPFELISYCLMTNHFHLQIRSKEQPLSKVMSLINKQYADYYNTKNKVTGHVFEKRYYDRLAESKLAMLKVSRYIHLNPVDASMVTNAQSYQWSSYWYYMHTSTHGLLNTAIILDCFPGNEWEKRRRYREFCEEVPVTTRILSNST